jgi:hypothetical protein
MGVAAVGAIASDVLSTTAIDIVGSALTGAVVGGVMGGDPLMGALTGGIGGGIMNAAGMGGGLLNYGQGGNIFGGIQGAEGGVMTADQMAQAVKAYTDAGYSTTDALNFIGQSAGGVDAATVQGIMQGGGTLNMAAQGAFSPTLASRLGTISQGSKMGGLGNVANLAQIGMGAYNLMNPPQSPQAATAAADPWSQYRTQAANQLNQLMTNPNMVYGMPGYQFAQQQGAKNIQRQAAATGQAISGGTLASLQQQGAQTAQNWFNQYVNTLGTQAGVTNAGLGVQAGQFQQQQQNASQTAALQNIMAGAAGLSQAGFFG